MKREDGGRFEKRVLLPTVSRKEKINLGVGKCGLRGLRKR